MVFSDSEIKATPYVLSWPTHMLGIWPICNVHSYNQEQLPLEVASDMFLMIAAVAQRQNNNVAYLKPYEPMMHMWADFIVSQLPLPPKQKCTDDFEGASPNNTNLAMKGAIALEAYALLLDMLGQKASAQVYRMESKATAEFWLQHAPEGSGPTRHYRREFQLNNSYSIKYNFIFQMILNVTVFPRRVIDDEVLYYISQKAQKYGIPLDDRNLFTLSEYQGLLAGLAPPNSPARQVFINQLFDFLNETPQRYPFCDYYFTNTAQANQQGAFVARATVGDLYAVMMFPNTA